MGVRESIAKSQGIAVAIAVVMIGGAAFLLYQNRAPASTWLTTRSFYSTDDGASWFVEEADKIPPFQHEGKTAFRASVFTDGSKQFVGFLERYTPEAQKKLEAAKAGQTEPPGRSVLSVMDELLMTGTEVKKPGSTNEWIRRNDRDRAPAVLDVKLPGGQSAQQVIP